MKAGWSMEEICQVKQFEVFKKVSKFLRELQVQVNYDSDFFEKEKSGDRVIVRM